MRNIFITLLIGAGLTSCSFGFYKKTHFTQYSIEKQKTDTLFGILDSLILPYKSAMDKEMNQVIGEAKVDFIKAKPNGNLNNLIADILMSTKKYFNIVNENVICIHNYGGIRANISKGGITVGDIFSVLPFDNYVFAVKLSKESIPDIIDWYKKANGHPIAGAKIIGNEIVLNNRKTLDNDFWVITNDYLYFGGDKAFYFQKKLELKESTMLLRDVVIDYIKSNPNVLDDNKERIKF